MFECSPVPGDAPFTDPSACTPDLQNVSPTAPVVSAHLWLVELEVNQVQESSVAAHDMVLPEAVADGKTKGEELVFHNPRRCRFAQSSGSEHRCLPEQVTLLVPLFFVLLRNKESE